MTEAIPDDPMLPEYTDKCRCMACGQYFNSTFAFSKHRKGKVGTPERRCLTEMDMRSTGWTRGGLGHWRTPIKGTGVRAVHLRQNGIKPEAL